MTMGTRVMCITSDATHRSGDWRVHDIATLPNRQLLGVGPDGLILSWLADSSWIERAPQPERDTLVRIAVTPGQPVTVLGHHSILRKDSAGNWVTYRDFGSSGGRLQELAAVSAGVLTISVSDNQDSWTLWLVTSDTAQGLSGQFRMGRAPIMHALADGRVVLVYASPRNREIGGSLRMLLPPDYEIGPRIPLPFNMNGYGVSDDGEFLYVVGIGVWSHVKIPLDSLPFSSGGLAR